MKNEPIWNDPHGLGWHVWRRNHSMGVSNQQDRHVRSHILSRHGLLSNDIAKRWRLGLRPYAGAQHLKLPLVISSPLRDGPRGQSTRMPPQSSVQRVLTAPSAQNGPGIAAMPLPSMHTQHADRTLPNPANREPTRPPVSQTRPSVKRVSGPSPAGQLQRVYFDHNDGHGKRAATMAGLLTQNATHPGSGSAIAVSGQYDTGIGVDFSISPIQIQTSGRSAGFGVSSQRPYISSRQTSGISVWDRRNTNAAAVSISHAGHGSNRIVSSGEPLPLLRKKMIPMHFPGQQTAPANHRTSGLERHHTPGNQPGIMATPQGLANRHAPVQLDSNRHGQPLPIVTASLAAGKVRSGRHTLNFFPSVLAWPSGRSAIITPKISASRLLERPSENFHPMGRAVRSAPTLRPAQPHGPFITRNPGTHTQPPFQHTIPTIVHLPLGSTSSAHASARVQRMPAKHIANRSFDNHADRVSADLRDNSTAKPLSVDNTTNGIDQAETALKQTHGHQAIPGYHLIPGHGIAAGVALNRPPKTYSRQPTPGNQLPVLQRARGAEKKQAETTNPMAHQPVPPGDYCPERQPNERGMIRPVTLSVQRPASAVSLLIPTTISSGFTGAAAPAAKIIHRRGQQHAGLGNALIHLKSFAAPDRKVSEAGKAGANPTDTRSVDSDIGTQPIIRLKGDGVPTAPSIQRSWVPPRQLAFPAKTRVPGVLDSHPHDGSLNSIGQFKANSGRPSTKPPAPSAVSLMPRSIAIQCKPVEPHQRHQSIVQTLTPAMKSLTPFAHQIDNQSGDPTPTTRSKRSVLPLVNQTANQIQRKVRSGVDAGGGATAINRVALPALAAGAGSPPNSPETAAAEEASGDTAAGQVDINELAEKAWQKIMHKLVIERERRGLTPWH